METLWAIISIIIIDLALSGDNAAVIGLAIRKLEPRLQKRAAVLGAGGAIALRVALTFIAILLLEIPYLRVTGGIILLWITWKLIAGAKEIEEEKVESKSRFWGAVWTILIADLSMAFDNVLAVAGAAHGKIELVIFGLVLSIPILILGARWLATLMNRYPLVIYVGGAVLARTSLAMIIHDPGLRFSEYLGELSTTLIPWLMALLVFIWGWFQVRKPF